MKIVPASTADTSSPRVLSCEVCQYQQATRAIEWQLTHHRDIQTYGRFGRIPICERPQCAITSIEWLPPLAGSFELVPLNGRPS